MTTNKQELQEALLLVVQFASEEAKKRSANCKEKVAAWHALPHNCTRKEMAVVDKELQLARQSNQTAVTGMDFLQQLTELAVEA